MVGVDGALFGFDGEVLKLLLIRQRTSEVGPLRRRNCDGPARDFVHADESLDAAAGRVLGELAGLDNVYKRFHAFGDPYRVKA